MLHAKANISSEAPTKKVREDIEEKFNSVTGEDMQYNESDGTYGRRDDGMQQFKQRLNKNKLPSMHSMDGVWYLRVPRNISAMKLITHVADILSKRDDSFVVEDIDYSSL